MFMNAGSFDDKSKAVLEKTKSRGHFCMSTKVLYDFETTMYGYIASRGSGNLHWCKDNSC